MNKKEIETAIEMGKTHFIDGPISLQTATALVQELNDLSKTIEETFEGQRSKTYAAYKEIIAQRDKYLDPVKAVIKTLRGRIAHYMNASGDEAAGASKVDNWKAVVVDADRIPRKYMVPDMKRLNEIAKGLQAEFNIPGCRVENKPYVRMK